MIIVGNRTIIRRLERKDLDKMVNWGQHKDPTFYHYNFPSLTKEEKDLWYKLKAQKARKKCFAVENMQGNIIGYISLRDIKIFKRESELGIVLDPFYINKGYGTDALCNLLELYFKNLRMKRLILKVAKFNKRAIRCYEKSGFEVYAEVIDEFEEQEISERLKKDIVNKHKYFDINQDGKLITEYYCMEITKKEYIIHKERDKLLISL